MRRLSLHGLLAQAQAWLFVLLWARGSGSARPARQVLGLAAACAALALVLQAPGLREEAMAQETRIRQLQERRAELQRQWQEQQALLATGPASSPASASASAWRWHELALAAGLRLEHLKPVATSVPGLQQWQLRVRGRYAQHGAWAAALAVQPLRLVRYQLQAAPDGLHLADLVIEPVMVIPGSAPDAPAPRYAASPHLDPLGEPGPADPWADLPAAWRAQAQRPRALLETAPLSAFALSGTLRRGEEWLALLNWQRMTHTVRVGDALGQHLGRVQRIDEQGLLLREIVRDATGQWVEHERLWRVGEGP